MQPCTTKRSHPTIPYTSNSDKTNRSKRYNKSVECIDVRIATLQSQIYARQHMLSVQQMPSQHFMQFPIQMCPPDFMQYPPQMCPSISFSSPKKKSVQTCATASPTISPPALKRKDLRIIIPVDHPEDDNSCRYLGLIPISEITKQIYLRVQLEEQSDFIRESTSSSSLCKDIPVEDVRMFPLETPLVDHVKKTYLFGKDKYFTIKYINRGSAGTVYLVKKELTGESFALKLSHPEKDKACHSILHEASILHMINSDFSTTMLHSVIGIQQGPFDVSRGQLKHRNMQSAMLTSFYKGNLSQLLASEKLTKDRADLFVKQLLSGFGSLKEKKIIHGDLRLNNIFYRDDEICFGDFGHAMTIQSAHIFNPIACAESYAANPEYDSSAYIFSLAKLKRDLDQSIIEETEAREQAIHIHSEYEYKILEGILRNIKANSLDLTIQAKDDAEMP